jgi:hypothetical protein
MSCNRIAVIEISKSLLFDRFVNILVIGGPSYLFGSPPASFRIRYPTASSGSQLLSKRSLFPGPNKA